MKSLRDLKTKEEIKYRIKVKDLIHWEGFSLPVVLIIWDINMREGRWILIRDLIEQLDKLKPNWRDLKTKTTIHIPWSNTTDDEGLKRLKVEIGRSVYSLISAGKDLKMRVKFAFPNTEEGKKLQAAFEKHIQEGEPFTASGSYIQDIQFSEWWEKWFGEFDKEKAELEIGLAPSSEPVLFSITLNPKDGETVTLSGLEFYLVKAGTDYVEFSNESTTFPINFTLSFRQTGKKIEGDISYSHKNIPIQAHDLLLVLDFFEAMSSGGSVLVRVGGDGEQIHTGVYQPVESAKPDPSYKDLVEKLCSIQNITGEFFTVPEDDIGENNTTGINELSEIFSKGYTLYPNSSLSFQLKGDSVRKMAEVHKQGKPIHLRLSTPESYVEIFEKKVNVGPMVRDMTGVIGEAPDDFEEKVRKASPDEHITVALVNCMIVEHFPNWARVTLEEILSKKTA